MAVSQELGRPYDTPALDAALVEHQGPQRSELVTRLRLRALEMRNPRDAILAGQEDSGWCPIARIAAAVGFEARAVRAVLVEDRASRRRRPGRDSRWRDPAWIHSTEVKTTVGRCGASYWKGVSAGR